MTDTQQDTVIRQYEVSFEGHPGEIHIDLEAPASRSMIGNFLAAVAKARDVIASAVPDADTRRITGFRKTGEAIRYAVEGEYTNDGSPPTWIDCVFAVDDEDARFQTKLAVALNEGWDFSELGSLRTHMKTIRVIQCQPEPFSKDDITAALANFLSAYNAGENISGHIQTLTKIAEASGHVIWKAPSGA